MESLVEQKNTAAESVITEPEEKETSGMAEGAEKDADPEDLYDLRSYEEIASRNPFDIVARLESFRNLSPEEEKLPWEEKRKLLRRRLEEIKADLNFKEEYVAEIILSLRKKMEAETPPSRKEMSDFARKECRECGLLGYEVQEFFVAIDRFLWRAEIMRDILERNKTPEDVFFYLFGRKPLGKIEIEPRAFSIHIKCHDESDYVFAFGRGSDPSDQDRDRANDSAGVAIGELMDAPVSVESLSKCMMAERQIETRTESIPYMATYKIDDEAEVYIKAAGAGLWRLDFFDDSIDVAGEDYVLKKWDRIASPGSARGGFVLGGDSVHPVREAVYIVKSGKKPVMKLTIRFDEVVVENLYTKPLTREMTVGTLHSVLNKKRLSEVVEHEEQHQCNNLFEPITETVYVAGYARSLLDSGMDKEIMERKFTDRLVALYRVGIDEMARSEMLAYMKEGRSAKQVKEILLKSRLYDYKKLNPKLIGGIFDKITLLLERIRGNVEKGGGGEDDLLEFLKTPSKNDVNEAIGRVFGPMYEADVSLWVDSAYALIEKGYSKDEALALLYKEPVERWGIMARRLPGKKLQSV